MKAFLKAAAHAAVGGFLAGAGAVYGGASGYKAVVFSGLASAVTSVLSLFSEKPKA